MKIIFVRHGEGLDDIYNEYGGWSDRELSPSGIKMAFNISKYLKDKKYDYDLVLTSPLKRTYQTAQIIAEELACRMEECAYLKERNTYGLLSGVNKDIAIKHYPDLVKAYNNEEYIPGCERYEDFSFRVAGLIQHLKDLKEKTIVCVTHGFLITTFIEEILGLVRDEIEDGCILEVELKTNGTFNIIDSRGLTYAKSAKELPKHTISQRRKFKNV